jgi:hypothetical protein
MGLKHKPRPIKDELKGMPCRHPKVKIVTETNRKGRKFKECSRCNAFLGYVL